MEKKFKLLLLRIRRLDTEIVRLQQTIQRISHDEEESPLATAQRMYLAGLRDAKQILLAGMVIKNKF